MQVHHQSTWAGLGAGHMLCGRGRPTAGRRLQEAFPGGDVVREGLAGAVGLALVLAVVRRGSVLTPQIVAVVVVPFGEALRCNGRQRTHAAKPNPPTTLHDRP